MALQHKSLDEELQGRLSNRLQHINCSNMSYKFALDFSVARARTKQNKLNVAIKEKDPMIRALKLGLMINSHLVLVTIVTSY